MENAIQKAVRLAGGQTALADLIGRPVRQGHVWKWLRNGYVPAEQVLAVVRALDGRMTPHEIRPDIYPDPDWMPKDLDAPERNEAPASDERVDAAL